MTTRTEVEPRAATARENEVVRYKHLPITLTHGSGPYIWDVAGKCYLDLTGSSGTNILGHRDPKTTLAVINALAEGGFLFDGKSADEVAVAEALRRLYGAEDVQFFRTGSCATSAAVRVMRIASGRDRILTSGYHGWHDWIAEQVDYPGEGRVVDFAYDLDVLQRLLDRGDVGGVFVTLLAHTFAPNYWHELKRITESAGVFLAVDEIKTGVRYGLGGMSQTIGVTPDITLLSKGLTNGMALSAFVDHVGLLKYASATNLGGTYRTERTPFAAARAMLEQLEHEAEVFDHLRRITDQFVQGMNEVLTRESIGAAVFGRFGDLELVCESPRFWDELRLAGLTVGLFLPDDGNIMLTRAHQSEHIETAIKSLSAAMLGCANAKVDGCGGRITHRAIQREYGLTFAQIAEWGTPELQAILV